LYLKFLLELAWELRGHTGKAPRVHGLLQLWNTVRPFLEPDAPSSALDAAAQVIADLQDVDPGSAEARYAEGETRGLVESLAKVPDGFNPEHFAHVLTKVSELFDGIQTEYSQRLMANADFA
jgi:hypothetical protein